MHKRTANRAKKSSQEHKKDVLLTVQEEVPLMEFLIVQLPHKSRDNVKSLLRNKQIWVEDQIISQFNYQLRKGQTIKISASRSRSEKKFTDFTIVFEDDNLIVIDKSAGLLSIATGSDKTHNAYRMLSDYVKTQDHKSKIFVVHRLDRETSGLMVFAKNEEVKKLLQDNWNGPETHKSYVALVEGKVEKQEGTIVSYLFEDRVYRVYSSQDPKKGQKAITNYRVLESNVYFSLLLVDIETGRKNQIRVHMQEMGHSIVGDKKYGAVSNPIRRLGLHAQKLKFVHPITGEKLSFETKVPSVFLSLLKRKYK